MHFFRKTNIYFLLIITHLVFSGSFFLSYFIGVNFQSNLKLENTFFLFSILPLISFFLYTFYFFFKLKLRSSFFLSIFTFLPFLIFFYNFFFQPINYDYTDDGYKYFMVADYFYNNKTLVYRSAFTNQVGYSYFLVLYNFIFSKKIILIQLINIIICYTSIAFILNFFENIKIKNIDKFILFISILILTLFLSKNIILNLGEWFIISILFLLPYIYKKNFLLFSFCLSFIILCKNHLFLIILLFYLMIFFKKKSLASSAIFIIVLFWPSLHNYIFFKELSFLSNSNVVLQASNLENFSDIAATLKYTINYCLSYIGISKQYYNNFKILNSTTIISLLTLPLLFSMFCYFFFRFDKKYKVLIVIFFILSAGPTFFFGWAYYPRFQVINYFFTIIFILIYKYLIKVSCVKKN